jgi:hypothetical protein
LPAPCPGILLLVAAFRRAERQRDPDEHTIAPGAEGNRGAGCFVSNYRDEIAGSHKRCPVDRSDHVTCHNSSLCGGAPCFRLVENCSMGYRHPETCGEWRSHRAHLSTYPPARCASCWSILSRDNRIRIIAAHVDLPIFPSRGAARNPTTGTLRCSVRAASGHAAAPPRSVMKARRLVNRNVSVAIAGVTALLRIREDGVARPATVQDFVPAYGAYYSS